MRRMRSWGQQLDYGRALPTGLAASGIMTHDIGKPMFKRVDLVHVTPCSLLLYFVIIVVAEVAVIAVVVVVVSGDAGEMLIVLDRSESETHKWIL
jgi:hypothetical protein